MGGQCREMVNPHAYSRLEELSSRRAQPATPCVFYLPRIDSWAVNVQPPNAERGDDSAGTAALAASPPEEFPISAAKKRLSPLKTYATSASPFRYAALSRVQLLGNFSATLKAFLCSNELACRPPFHCDVDR